MKLVLCLILGFLTFSQTVARSIKIQIDPDDLLRIVDGVMKSETFKNFANQFVQRDIGNRIGYNNPYHPEDELLNTFDATVDKAKKHFEPKQKTYKLSEKGIDNLSKENDNFVLGNDVQSDDGDLLTENELENEIVAKSSSTTPKSKPVAEKIKHTKVKHAKVNPVRLVDASIETAVASQRILTRKDAKEQVFEDDRASYKPRQTRFVLKNSNDTN